MSSPPEHPRLRGDHSPAGRAVTRSLGTPPPARGPPGWSGRRRRPERNTPACAGTTAGPACLPAAGPEHPRLRGDHDLEVFAAFQCGGTPPPARGPPGEERDDPGVGRNTPACAGTTFARCKRSGCPPEHPRLRGDHSAPGARRSRKAGTPPPARGPRHGRLDRGADVRNTPACAGTTPTAESPKPGTKEHPRLRGDHGWMGADQPAPGGTPPPARGPPGERLVLRDGRRNTPACAGTTGPRGLTLEEPPEHPRLRGDHLL